MSWQRRDHTLQPTALVHEAYLRLVRRGDLEDVAAADFFAMAARAMRSVLVDHARRRNRLKRRGDAIREPLDDVVDLFEERAIDLLALDEALIRLAERDAEQARVVELRFFGGMSAEDTAAMLGVSPRTIGRLWNKARAWLREEIQVDDKDNE